MLSEQAYLNKIRPTKPVVPSKPVSDEARVVDYLSAFGYGLFKTRKAWISGTKGRELRLARKRLVLAEFNPWINEVLNADFSVVQGHSASMFIWFVVWATDAGFYEQALHMAEFALKHALIMPDEFSRNLPELIAEEIADHALKQAFNVDAETGNCVKQVVTLVEGQDMNDAISAKLNKALGFLVYANDREQARHYWTLADSLYPRVGVRRLLRDLAKADNTGRARAKQVKASISEYTMSACQAAKRLGLSPITVQRRAAKYPDLLPHISIKVGERVLRRFNPKDIDSYYKTNLVSKPV